MRVREEERKERREEEEEGKKICFKMYRGRLCFTSFSDCLETDAPSCTDITGSRDKHFGK